MAVTICFTLVSVDADSSMGYVVDSSDEPWVASPGDESWEFGGVSGRLVERMEEIDIGCEGVVVGLACACAVCADEFGGSVGDHDGGVGREG